VRLSDIDFMNPPSRRARIRIDDVAKLAGVSPATVSRVMSGSRPVSAGVRDRVLAAALRFDYKPSQLARNLRRGQADTVGVLVADIENPHFSAMVRAIEEALYERGTRVLLCDTAEDTQRQAACLEVMEAERVMGVVISPTADGDGDAAISHLIDLGVPVVAFDRPVKDPRADAVIADSFAAIARGAQLLVDSGRRHIGFIGGNELIWTAAERLSGYQSTVAEAGLEPIMAVGDFTVEGGRLATERLVADNPDLDGLVVANNQMTIGALQALRAGQIALPEQVGVVAFDDPPWARLLTPSLTTLAQPLREMSRAAVDRLFLRMADRELPPERICFECRLEIRESSRGLSQRIGG